MREGLSEYVFEFFVGGVRLIHRPCSRRLVRMEVDDDPPWTALNVLVATSQHRCGVARPTEEDPGAVVEVATVEASLEDALRAIRGEGT